MQDQIKSIIIWGMDHPATVTAAAVALYPLADIVLRLFISEETVTKWETEGGKIVSVLAKIYRILEPFFSKSR